MGKGDRRRRKPAPLPGLPPVKRKPRQQRQNGQFASGDGQDPRKTVIEARDRHYKNKGTDNARELMLEPMAGDDVGRLILHFISNPQDRAKMWSVWQGFCVAEHNYRTRILGMSGRPKGAAIAIMPEAMQTDDNHSVDLRDPDQKDRDASNNWARWRGYVGHLRANRRSLLHSVEVGEVVELWQQGPTRHGEAFYAALRDLAEAAN